MLKILFMGDIVGAPGRQAVTTLLPKLRKKYSLDLVVANGENVSHGRGISLNHYQELRAAGIDWLTSGDHIWKRPDVFPYLDDPKIQILRPANYAGAVPGRGLASFSLSTSDVKTSKTSEVNQIPVHLINLQGRVFMAESTDNPFTMFDTLAKRLKGIILVDFHAEATSEKWAFGHYVSDRAAVVVGTHTHVQTADERILGNGTAFISDLGMTGSIDSNIGAEKRTIINHFLTGLPWKYEVAEGDPIWLTGAIVTINPKTDRATAIERIKEVLTN